MTLPLLNLSGKIDAALVEVCAAVATCAEKLQIPYLIVGAFARDLVMHYGYGAAIQRATTDIDFALQLPSWDAFSALKQELIANQFTEAKSAHRLIAPNKWPIDIVPFGGVADKNAIIAWPPSGDFVMTTLGFDEALARANIVRLREAPNLDIPVASPAGMIILKLISWMDRETDVRNKDAKDIAYLLSSYEAIPAVSDQLYENQKLMEAYGWDITLAAAHQIGMDAKRIASVRTALTICELLNNQGSPPQLGRLINEMGDGSTHQHSYNKSVINSFKTGFKNSF